MSLIERSSRTEPVNHEVPAIDIVVPVYNEEKQLGPSVRALHQYVSWNLPFSTRIVIADNASTDGTWEQAKVLGAALPGVDIMHLDEKGRGRALRAAWSASHASVVAYLDVDLSTGLEALLPLVAPLISGHSDLAIGTRLARGARVVRSPVRELISRGYVALVRLVLRGRFSDAQCGFKALRREVAGQLLPLIEDEEWFFDTELLIVAERAGMRVHEVPVDWVDDPDSRVDIGRTIRDDLRGIRRMMRARGPGPSADIRGQATSADLLTFAGFGVRSILAQLGVFAALWPVVGAMAANALSVLCCGTANMAIHRGLVWRGCSRARRKERGMQSLVLLSSGLAVTAAGLGIALAIDASSLPGLLAALGAADALAAVVRFWLLRCWVCKPLFASPPRRLGASKVTVPRLGRAAR